MSIRSYLLYFMVTSLIIASPQINLHLTDLIGNDENVNGFQHDCLDAAAPIDKENDRYQIISYCMSEWPSKWNVKNNDLYQKFTFAELYKQQITSEQLYIWSAPMDIIESYQYYLNHFSTLNKTSIGTQIFYNCTLPRFGSQCQYEFEYYQSDYASLDEIINDYYLNHPYEPTTLTCYMHLECNRGSVSACLDWSDICDGKVDCFDNGNDEKHCWQLEMNECEDNQFRCINGQCIPYKFFLDDYIVPDCLDGSDEQLIVDIGNECKTTEPTFLCEDIICTMLRRQYRKPLTSSCVYGRRHLLEQAMFSNKPMSINESCWLAFKCIIHMPIPRDPTCLDLCQNGTCEDIILRTCPDILYVPAIPVLFGHVYFAYTKNDSKYSARLPCQPQYICYNNQLCGELMANKILISFNNSTCGHLFDFPIPFINDGRASFIDTFVLPSYNLFRTCSSIVNTHITYCNRSTMYQCIKSSKCISIYHLRDGIVDCYHNDDEDPTVISNISSPELLKRYFKCITTNEYISHLLVGDGRCDCSLYNNGLCDDEYPDIRYEKSHISFQTICDDFQELFPITIDERNATDETECEHWSCNNRYTRCNGLWNCVNGADEIDCDSSPLIKCPLYHHICVSPVTNQLICLPIKKANDGEIDCLGATDEPKLCQSDDYRDNEENFYCKNYGFGSCIQSIHLCDRYNMCLYGEDQQACDITRNFTADEGICNDKYISNRSVVEKFLCGRSTDKRKQPIVYFSLSGAKNSISAMRSQQKTEVISHLSTISSTHSLQQRCHRGLNLRIWLDNEKKITTNTCLCPPSFYGNMCQYQNQRVSLTVQFTALSASWQIPFSIVVSLIDDSHQRIIHSYEQVSYLSMRDCQKKFSLYLLYSTRPKDIMKHYSIHIDIYETILITYRGSFLIPLTFPFLPVHRLALRLNIPPRNDSMESCSDRRCLHGKCMRYNLDKNNTTFCHCYRGWSGRYCTIPHDCQCSSDSLCIGIAANNRSICICPINKFGSRCLLNKTVCQFEGNMTCLNDGECISTDKHSISNKKFTCICPNGFSGDRCEIIDTKIVVTFHKDIVLSQSILVHFIQVINNAPPKRITTFSTLSYTQNTAIVYWSYPFHLIFIELINKTYYLTVVQKTYNPSITIVKTIEPSDRCKHINEIFNDTMVNLHLLRRIKYYHLPCQKYFSSLKCFYDDIHLCLCENFNQQYQANCLEFNHQMKFDCLGQSSCENDAQCFQDNPTCPQKSMCICPTCFYGNRCQFNTMGFGLFLDAILGYNILPEISLIHQPLIIKISLVMTIIITLIGLINGILSLITFSNKKLREVGCGLYLLGSSITTLLVTMMFLLKFSILLGTQIARVHDRSFLYFQCISIDFLLRICLTMDQWLNACVAVERAITSIKGTKFNKKKSKQIAKYTILGLLLSAISTNIHDPIHRRLLDDDEDGYIKKKRIWCIITYSFRIQIFNSFINIFHFSIPFFLNLISAFIIIKTKARQRAIVQSEQTYNQVLHNQFREYRHLIITPLLLVVLSFPRVILTLVSGCMTSIQDSWLFLIGYFISFLPSMMIFIVFILPSKFYKGELYRSIKRYRQRIQNLLNSL